MRSVVLLATFAFVISGCRDPSPNPSLPTVGATQTDGEGAVAGIWWENSVPTPVNPPAHQLIVGVWQDGTVIWSSDRQFGGPPYMRGHIPVSKVDALVERLNGTGFFELKRQANFGPDASYTVIAAQAAHGKHQWVGSWHEPSSPGVIVTERGIQSSIDAASESPSKEYQQFLKVWADARAAIENAIPAEGATTRSVDETIYKLGR